MRTLQQNSNEIRHSAHEYVFSPCLAYPPRGVNSRFSPLTSYARAHEPEFDWLSCCPFGSDAAGPYAAISSAGCSVVVKAGVAMQVCGCRCGSCNLGLLVPCSVQCLSLAVSVSLSLAPSLTNLADIALSLVSVAFSAFSIQIRTARLGRSMFK